MLKKKSKYLLVVVLMMLVLPGWSQLRLGTVENLTFFSEALERESTVRVYLPPGYDASDELTKYPVIFTLHGASMGNELYNYMFPIIDALWLSRSIDHFILVMPDGTAAPFNGSFFTNSSLYGNYEDLISYDIVPLIDSVYHTYGTRDMRAIMGQSMGSYGAFKQVLKHPDLFCAIAGHSGPVHIEMLQMLIPDVKAENGDPPYTWNHTPGKGLTNLIMTMAGAFSPNPESPNLVDFPMDDQGELIDSVMQRWNPHNIVEMVRWHMPATDLAIYFDCGSQDEYYLYLHNRALSDSLNLYGIKHQYVEYFGDHTSGLVFRVPVAFNFIDQVFKGNITTGLDARPDHKEVVQVFPNPSDEWLWFRPEHPSELKSIRIFNQLGAQINQINKNQNPIDIRHLPAGIYHVVFDHVSGSSSYQVIIR